jgi:hypothetical protein
MDSALLSTNELMPSDGMADMKEGCEFTPPRWKYLHPVQDVAALRAEVDAGFRSRASIIHEMGYDATDVDNERAADKQREQALDLASPEDRLAQAQIAQLEAQRKAAESAANSERTKTEATGKLTQAQVSLMESQRKAAEAEATTTNQTRPHAIATEKAKTEAARLELQAATEGLAELRQPVDYGMNQFIGRMK